MIARRFSNGITLSIGLLALAAHGGSVDNRNNNSADYIRSLSRNAATEGADASIYNPAGTVRFKDGLHLSLNNQTLAKFNEQKLANPSISYKQDLVSPLYPTAFAVYKKANWSAFGAFSFPGGGGELEYKEGSATVFLLQSNLHAFNPSRNADAYLRSVYMGGTVGGAYAPKEWISLSLAARALYARTDINVDAGVKLAPLNTTKAVDHMEEARGYTAILGVDVFPRPDLILAVRFEGPTPLEWEVQRSTLNLEEVIKDANARAAFTAGLRQSLRAPGEKFQRDLPAVLNLGAAYTGLPSLRTDFSFNYYFQTLADWGGKENLHDDGWEAALAFEYQTPIPLSLSAGGMYTVSGANSTSYQVENPALDSYTIGLGGRYDVADRFAVSAGWAGNFTFSDETTIALPPTTVELTKSVLVYSIGIEYRAF